MFFFDSFGWGCLQIGTELSRLFLPDKRVELSFGRYDAGIIDKPSITFDGFFDSPPLLRKVLATCPSAFKV